MVENIRGHHCVCSEQTCVDQTASSMDSDLTSAEKRDSLLYNGFLSTNLSMNQEHSLSHTHFAVDGIKPVTSVLLDSPITVITQRPFNDGCSE